MTHQKPGDVAFKMIDLSKLHINPKNPRILKDARFQKLCNLMTRYPKLLEKHPILARKDGTIYDGNQRYRAAQHLGWTEIPADIDDIDETTATEWSVILNNHAGEFDDSIATVLDELEKQGVPIEDLCMSEQVEKIIEELNRKEIIEDEAPPVPKVAKSKLGDLYILGNHRLLCGDACKLEDYEKLLGGEKGDLLLTDPPYGVSYADKNEFLNSISDGVRLTDRIENDHQTPEEMYDFWLQVFGSMCVSLKDVSSYYIFSPQGGDLLLLLLLQSVRDSGFQLKHVLIWAKNNHVLGRADYNYKHEPIVYGWKKNGTHEFYGKGEFQTSVWEYDKPLKNDLHPTMKPIGVLTNAILNSSKEGDIVLDPFLGSGSTMIAAEQTGRRCYGMEISPLYVDVAVRRWENLTGKKAVLQ